MNIKSLFEIVDGSRIPKNENGITVLCNRELVLGRNSLNIIFSEIDMHAYNTYMFSQFLPLILAFDYVNHKKEKVLILSYNFDGTMLSDVVDSLKSFREFELKQDERICIPFDEPNIVNVTKSVFDYIDIDTSAPFLFNVNAETAKAYLELKNLIKKQQYGLVIINPLISALSPISTSIEDRNKIYRALLSLQALASETESIILPICGIGYDDSLKKSFFNNNEERINRFKWLIGRFAWFPNNAFSNERLYRYALNTVIDEVFWNGLKEVKDNYVDCNNIEPFKVET